MTTTPITDQDLAAQQAYASAKADLFDYNVVVADAFVRGIRELGYRDSARALDELIDNSIQAGADEIAIEFGYLGKSDQKPTAIAIVDNGHGMYPEMLRMSVIWGGTHREGDRTGFGRFGWGLPSASVSIGRAFSVYSRPTGEPLNSVTVDLNAIARGTASQDDGRIIVAPAASAELPEWLVEKLPASLAPLTRGTAVVISDLDKISWKTKKKLESKLLQHIGLIYRRFLRDRKITINGKRVEPIDPLFTTPGARFYDLDEDQAEALPPLEFTVKDPETRKPQGVVRVRYSYMYPTFARVDKQKSPRARGNNNSRFEILDENNGLIVMREGRQIDVVSKRGYLVVNNDDRYWGVEVDFPATLDEELSITTSKQQVVLSDRLWEALKQHGVLAAIAEMRSRYDRDTKKLKADRERRELTGESPKRLSEEAMAKSEKHTTRRPVDTQTKKDQNQQELDKEVRERADETGVAPEVIEEKILSDAAENPFKVVEKEMGEAPFYRPRQLGGQRVLELNTEHRFYVDVYAGPDTNARTQAALEVLLFALAQTELDAGTDRQAFYSSERPAWSERLDTALRALEEIDGVREAQAAQRDPDGD